MISFSEINTENTIIYYGGSFNPPHIAHIMMVSQLRAYFPKAQIWIAPTYLHAFDKKLIDFDLRMEMLKRCLGDSGNVTISDIERDICLEEGSHKSYTIDVVRRLRKQNPDKRICIVVGADIIPTLPQWYCYEELMQLATFLFFPRQGYDNSQSLNVPFLPEVSSTEIREMLATGHDPERLRGLVPAVVLEMVTSTYSTPQACNIYSPG